MIDPYRLSARVQEEDTTVIDVYTFDWGLVNYHLAQGVVNPGWSIRQWRISKRCRLCGKGDRVGEGPWTEPSRPRLRCVNGHEMSAELLGEPRE